MKYVFESTSLVNNPMLWIWSDTASYKNNIMIALKSSHLAHFHEYEHDAFLNQMPIQTLEIRLLIHSHSRVCMSSSRVRQQLFNVYNNHFTCFFFFLCITKSIILITFWPYFWLSSHPLQNPFLWCTTRVSWPMSGFLGSDFFRVSNLMTPEW